MYPFRQQETDRLSAGGFLLPRVEGGPPRKKSFPILAQKSFPILCEKFCPSLERKFRPSLVKRSKSIILFAKQ